MACSGVRFSYNAACTVDWGDDYVDFADDLLYDNDFYGDFVLILMDLLNRMFKRPRLNNTESERPRSRFTALLISVSVDA